MCAEGKLVQSVLIVSRLFYETFLRERARASFVQTGERMYWCVADQADIASWLASHHDDEST
jgi:hypothetical protein